MDKFIKQLEDFEKSVRRLIEAVELAEKKKDTELYLFLRDSAIQRFEFTFEIFWKLVRTAVREFEGVECNSPKSCMRELFKNGYVGEEEVTQLFEMVDDRNLTAHTYNEELAEELFKKLKDYAELMNSVVGRIKNSSKKGNFS